MGPIDVSAAKAAFETASSYSGWATIAVAAGVFIELVDWLVSRNEMRPLQKTILIFATLLIVAGCCGEYIFGSWASGAASLLQRASEETIAESNRLAQLAEKDAAEAQLALKKMIAPRVLNEIQAVALSTKLGLYRGKGFWITTQKGPDSYFGEQLDLARQLKTVFLAAGWTLDSHSSMADRTQSDSEFEAVSDRGCDVDFAHDSSSSTLGHAIWTALQESGVDCKENPADGMVSEFIELEIGLR
jgi:hypothetical protein